MDGISRSQRDILDALQTQLQRLEGIDPAMADARQRIDADLAALRFHLSYDHRTPLIAIIGGTGTGKSTLLNRLVGRGVSATSHRRTYTAGPIAVTADANAIPAGWLGVDHERAPEPPARGRPDALIIVTTGADVQSWPIVLVDTPDVDGDEPAHAQAADRTFRWCTAVVFVVTPEKYQMTELLPYYRLARRYGLGAWFVMNKTEHLEAVEDYRRQLAMRDWPNAEMFVIERDDSTLAPPADASIDVLRNRLVTSRPHADRDGLHRRRQDLATRIVDHLLQPLRERRRQIDRLIRALHAMEQPQANVDVNPLTEQLRIRLQQRSILYLMGPKRMWERVRQTPGLLMRLPRTIWDAARGRKVSLPEPEQLPQTPDAAPDFAAAMREQFIVVQSRIDDVLRSDTMVSAWMEDEARGYTATRLDPVLAAQIADEEINDLKQWLRQRWDSHPRDTLLVMKLLRYLPGGQRVTKAVEAAPYLLLIFFLVHPGHVLHELLFGLGYAAVAGLVERLSNEVAARTRATNRRIGDRFAELAHRQIEQTIAWLASQCPSDEQLNQLQQAIERLDEMKI